MVDYFSLLITHGVLILAVWRLLWRDDLDADPPAVEAAKSLSGDEPGA